MLLLLAANAIAAENNHFTTELKTLKQYCYECHSGDDAESGVTFDRFTDSAEVQTDFELWERWFAWSRKADASGDAFELKNNHFRK